MTFEDLQTIIESIFRATQHLQAIASFDIPETGGFITTRGQNTDTLGIKCNLGDFAFMADEN